MAINGGDDSSDGWSSNDAIRCCNGDLHLALDKFNWSEEQRCNGSSDHATVEHS